MLWRLAFENFLVSSSDDDTGVGLKKLKGQKKFLKSFLDDHV
jgi:hypothetical protein